MILLDFLKQFTDKPKLHGDIWFYILCRTHSKISIIEIMSLYKVSKSSLYRIFSIYKSEIESDEEIIIFYIKTLIYIPCQNIKKKS